MNSFRNSVQLIGRLGQTPEVKDFNGNKMVRFSIATNDYSILKNGDKKEETYWHTVVIWGKQAENAEKLLEKGSEVLIDGKLISRTWADKDGFKRYITEVVANNFLLVGNRKPLLVEEQ
ncbi:MAG: single-stranded DNA-binding protein [Bacteroidales bacterium]|nr:single-stranded DNA-binding protein [Bacteroidales bacterium]